MSDPIAKPIGADFDMTPVTYQWTCRFCHRGFETVGIAGFKVPAEMICRSCSDAHEVKVAEGFVLELPHRNAAYAVVNMDVRSLERKEIVARWSRFANDAGNIYDRLKYSAMLQVIQDCDTGKTSPPIPQAKAKKGAW